MPTQAWSWWHEGHNGTHEQYSLSCAEFVELVLRAAGHCDRCATPYQKLVIDHDHAMGPRGVRGMLCHRCNALLGKVDAGRPADELTIAYLAAPFHASIPAERSKDPEKRERYAAPPTHHQPRRIRPAWSATGRPRTRTGVTPVRRFRISDDVHVVARRIADARGESLTEIVEKAVAAYARRHRADDPGAEAYEAYLAARKARTARYAREMLAAAEGKPEGRASKAMRAKPPGE